MDFVAKTENHIKIWYANAIFGTTTNKLLTTDASAERPPIRKKKKSIRFWLSAPIKDGTKYVHATKEITLDLISKLPKKTKEH